MKYFIGFFVSLLMVLTFLSISCSSNPSKPVTAATPTSTPQYSAGGVTLVAGTGSLQPYGIAFDGSSTANLWFVTNANPGYLYNYTAAGSLATSTDIYTGSSKYDYPTEISVDPNGYLYISDTNNNQIVVLTWAGLYVNVIPVTKPESCVVNAAGTTLYVSEDTQSPNSTYLTFSITGAIYPKTYTSVANSFPTSGAFDPVRGAQLALDSSGNVYSTDFNGTEIIKFTSTGSSPVTFIPAAHLPWGIAFDPSGNLFVTEQTSPNFIQEYSSTGSAGVSIGGSVFSTYTNIEAIAVDSSANLYVSESYTGNILKFTK